MNGHLEVRDYVQNGTMPSLRRAQLAALLDDYDRCTSHPGFFQRIKTINDINGNARRLYVCYNGCGGMMGVYQERYNRPPHLNGMIELPSIKVGYEEYKSWMDYAMEHGMYHA